MTPNVVFEQLLVVALVLICLLMHVWGPSARSPASQRPCKPAQPRRTRAKDPKPFTGYIPKPLWEACEQRRDARLKAPGAPPPMLIFTRGRRRTVDTSGQCCPDHDCSYHGWLGRGHIRSNGHPGGQPWRQLQCVSCQGYCIFHGCLPPSPEEGCHPVHVKPATQSMGRLPPSPREACHVHHRKVATNARRSL